jgi:hypothetical protein
MMRSSTWAFATFALAAAIGAARAELPLPTDGGEAASVPMAVLSPGDVGLYRQIFDAERAGRFETAKALFEQVSDTSLEGYVLAQHPYETPEWVAIPIERISEKYSWRGAISNLSPA